MNSWKTRKLIDKFFCKGIIVAGKFDEKLKYAKTMVPNSEAFLYEVDFKIKEYK
jgi:hypothetical protein